MKSKEVSSIKVGNHTIEITNADKIIYPHDGITKGDIITYYKKIAPVMIPYMKDRPISMQRFPDGIHGESFYQKNAADYFPEWISTKAITKKEGGEVNYVICNNTATLLYLANQACLTPHLWLSKITKLKYPDRMIFDLDPSNDDFNLVIEAAIAIKDILQEHGLKSFVMTTGSRGLHIVVPLRPTVSFVHVRAFAYAIAQQLAARDPEKFTTELSKAERKGRVFIDYLRNAFTATAVAPYALRAHDGAPLAAPISWKEVDATLSPQKFTIKNIFRRLMTQEDPWRDFKKAARVLPTLDEESVTKDDLEE